MRLLDELAELGMEQARALLRRVEAQAATGKPLSTRDTADVALAFERITREVCAAVERSARLDGELRSRTPRPAPRPARTPAPAPVLTPDGPGTKGTRH